MTFSLAEMLFILAEHYIYIILKMLFCSAEQFFCILGCSLCQVKLGLLIMTVQIGHSPYANWREE